MKKENYCFSLTFGIMYVSKGKVTNMERLWYAEGFSECT